MSKVVPLKAPHEHLGALYLRGLKLYDSGGLPRGALPGWPAVDDLYSVAPGQWTVVTGIPQSGKSEWLDALLVNLAEADPAWLFCVYSPENYPTETHLTKLVEKRIRKPHGPGIHQRMTRDEYAAGAAWVLEHFLWLDTELKTPEQLLDAGLAYGQGRKLGLVLDPWNTLDHQRGGLSETDYVSLVLTRVTQLARETKAHVWLVVHPAKIQKDRDGNRPIPTPYDISGSAHWYNKADNIVTIHRKQVERTQEVEIHVQKVRFKHIGHIGKATLRYDRVTGRYFEFEGVAGEHYADPESCYL